MSDVEAPIGRCGVCLAPLGGRHDPKCIHWGQVVPSECPGVIERALAEVLKRGKR